MEIQRNLGCRPLHVSRRRFQSILLWTGSCPTGTNPCRHSIPTLRIFQTTIYGIGHGREYCQVGRGEPLDRYTVGNISFQDCCHLGHLSSRGFANSPPDAATFVAFSLGRRSLVSWRYGPPPSCAGTWRIVV